MSENPLGPIVYKIIFGKEPEQVPDPNKPENVPRIKAMAGAKKEKFKRFWEGTGSVLLERWEEKIRENVFDLILMEEKCNCETCNKKREIAIILRMLSEAELILTQE